MNTTWNYIKRSDKLLIEFTKSEQTRNGKFSYLQIKPVFSQEYMANSYEKVAAIIQQYNPDNCLVIIQEQALAFNLITPQMKVIAKSNTAKGLAKYWTLTTIYGTSGERITGKNVYIEDYLHAYIVIEKKAYEYECILSERIAEEYFENNNIKTRLSDPFFEIKKNNKRYVLKYQYKKGRRKLIIIFNTLNGSIKDVKAGLFNQCQMKDYNYKDFAVLNCQESLSGYDGFYTYVFGESLINEITISLDQFIRAEGFKKQNVIILANGTGAIPGIIYANRLNIKQVICVNPRLDIVEEFNKKKNSCIRETFSEAQLRNLEHYFKHLLKREHYRFYFTNEKELLLNLKYINTSQTHTIGTEKLKNQFPKLIK